MNQNSVRILIENETELTVRRIINNPPIYFGFDRVIIRELKKNNWKKVRSTLTLIPVDYATLGLWTLTTDPEFEILWQHNRCVQFRVS